MLPANAGYVTFCREVLSSSPLRGQHDLRLKTGESPIQTNCDILIAGGGLVGLSLALLLSGAGRRIRIVDRAPVDEAAAPDERHLALSEVSCRTLEGLGVLQALGADAESIRGIHVSSAGEFGVARWLAAERGYPRFGMVAPARKLLAQMKKTLLTRPDIELIAPAGVEDVLADARAVQAAVDKSATRTPVRAPLLVVADGAESSLRTAAGIDAERHDYGRTAICCVVATERPHEGIAYERFTRGGPVAMLPQPRGQSGSIFIVDTQTAGALMQLSGRDYLDQLQRAFGYRLGRLRTAGTRVCYPLRRVVARALCAPRQVLIGNAAQALHPVGAQGFNLGLRDAAALAQRVRAAWAAGQDIGHVGLLTEYAESRRGDRNATAGLSHTLAMATTLDSPAAGWVRSLAIIAADRFEPLAEHLLLGGMGFRGATSDAARGLT